MKRLGWIGRGVVAGALCAGVVAPAQRPYVGFVYPAGGRQGTTVRIQIGGQNIDGPYGLYVTGGGVTSRVLEFHWNLNPQDVRLLQEQRDELRRQTTLSSPHLSNLIRRLQYRLDHYVQQPACRSIADIVIAEVTIAPDARPGERELRLLTARGPSNPLVFDIGQFPETVRPPMKTMPKQVLGKEALALRQRPPEEETVRIEPPCTMNGQIASREINRYRFAARRGQRLVIALRARQLIPYIADAVPGWFQPVIAVHDARGREIAYADDFRFRPDPVILFEPPEDGEYVLSIRDSIFRGREDFVYRATIGEIPFVTSIFPLGCRVGASPTVSVEGWNVEGARVEAPPTDVEGRASVVIVCRVIHANPMPFAVNALPEFLESETASPGARRITPPVIINGRIDRPDDWDVYEFVGRSNETIVAEVTARRLDSPLDSVLRLTDAAGHLIAFNDDWEDLASGWNTHHADSYLAVRLPADGLYRVHIGDTTRHGGSEHAYRLRISPPRPDFELRVVPSSALARGKDTFSVSVYGIRKDGFSGSIELGLVDPPRGVVARPATLVLNATQAVARLSVNVSGDGFHDVKLLKFEGRAKVGTHVIVRPAVPAEDRMQAFLWRHLLPAREFPLTHSSGATALQLPKPKPPEPPPPTTTRPPLTASAATSTNRFTKAQVEGRLRQLRRLYEAGLLTDDFYLARVAECQQAQ